MKKILLFVVLWCGLFASQKVDAQGWQWAKGSLCSSGLGSDVGMIAIDKVSSLPGLYVVGNNFGDSLCLPPYTIHNLLDSAQIIVAKYDTSGNVLWATGSRNGQCGAMNISSDALGNLFILGMLVTDSVSFGSHTIVNPNYIVGGGENKNHCYFILKIDPFGNVLLTTCGGNISEVGENLAIGGIAVDAANNIYVSASFDDSILQIGTHVFANSNPHHDSDDIFLVKYDPSGNFIWGKTFGGPGDDHGERLLIGNNNRLYLEGFFNSPTLAFGATNLTLSGTMYYFSDNVFLAELDTAGNPIWAMNPVGNGYTFGLSLDNNNDIYIGGAIYDTSMTFGSYSFHTQMLYRGSFLAKIDTFGIPLWAKYIYPLTHVAFGAEGTRVSDIAVDPCNNVWVTGRSVSDSLAINSSVLFHTFAPGGTDPMLFAGFTSSGTLLQSFYLNSAGDDDAGIVSDCAGNIYIDGDIEGSPTFKLILGSDTIFHWGGENMFVAKYNPNLGCVGVCSSTSITPISGDSILCKGDSLLLGDATGGGTWSSSNVSVATVGSGSGMVTGLSLGTAVITYSVGSGYVTKTVTVSASPAAITGDGVFGDFLCIFSLPTTLYDSVSGGIWSSSNSVALVGSTTGIVTLGTSWGLDTIFYTISPGCYTSILIDGCEGIAQNSGNTDHITLFPNPANDELTITSSGKISGIKITNLLGQTVYSRQFAGGSGQVRVDVSAFPPGVYFVKINGTEVRKFVKE